MSSQEFLTQTFNLQGGLPGAEIALLAEDPEGRVWIGTETSICHHEGWEWHCEATERVYGGKFFWPKGSRSERPWVLSSGWAGDQIQVPEAQGWHLQGVARPGDRALSHAFGEVDGEVWGMLGGRRLGLRIWRRGEWVARGSKDLGIPQGNIYSLLRRNDGWWIGTEHGLFHLPDPADRSLVEPHGADPGEPVLALAPTSGRDGTWVVGTDWIGLLEEDGFRRLEPPIPRLAPVVDSIIAGADALGGLYYGDSERLWRFQPGVGAEPLSRENGLVGEGVRAIALDHRNGVWIGSSGGLSRIVSRRFSNFRKGSGLPDSKVSAILPLSNGSLLIGHGQGLTWMSDGLEIQRHLPIERSQDAYIWDLEETSDGELLVAAHGLGVLVLSPDGRMRRSLPLSRLPEPQEERERQDFVQGAFQFDGGIWVAARSGLYRWQDREVTRVVLPVPGEPYPSVRRLKRLVSGEGFWVILSDHGLLRYRDGRFQHFVNPGNPQANRTWDVLEHADGRVWVATAQGIQELVDGKLEPLELPGFFDRGSLYFLGKDTRGALWVGTSSGVYRYAQGQVRQFSMADGLVGQEANRSAFHAAADGSVWIGTGRGLSVYRPQQDMETPPPRPRLEALEALGQTFPLDQEIELSRAGAVVVRFRFLAVRQPVMATTWMEGLEDHWSRPFKVQDREIRYANLPPGRFRFHLRLREPPGSWSREAVSGTIVVPKPVWQRTPFLAGLVFAAALLFWWLRHTLAQRRYARQLERDLQTRWLELLDSEERYRRVLGSITDSVITVDGEGAVAMVNPAAERLIGYREAEALGRPVESILELKASRLSRHDGREILEGISGSGLPEPLSFADIWSRDRRGTERLLDMVAAPILSPTDGQPDGAVLAFTDVTEKRREEEQQSRMERLESIGLLAGGIAHDFNNLLAGILGNLDLLSMEDLPTEGRVSCDEAQKAVDRARDLTQQLLTFSRGGSPIRQAASIAQVVEEAARLTLSGSKIKATFEIPDDLPAVDIDTGQMHQVFSNLFINAVEAMPDGGRLCIVAERVVPPLPLELESSVCVTVADDGPGIAKDLLERVFDPYVSTKNRGSGLGLSTCFSIVRRHDGLLTVDSTPGKGTTFQIFLPESSEEVVAGDVDTGDLIPVGGRILLMDDEEAVRRVTGRILQHSGFEVEAVDDGRKAVERYCAVCQSPVAFDAVIFDLTVPGGMGGREAFEILRGVDPHIRGIVASGYANDPVMAQYQAHGFRAVLPKPFRAKDLVSTVCEVLGQIRA